MALKIRHIIWQNTIVDKVQSKHQLDPDEVEEALLNDDPQPLIWREGDRYLACCQHPVSGRYILVIFAAVPPESIRIISAYDMPEIYLTKYKKWLGD